MARRIRVELVTVTVTVTVLALTLLLLDSAKGWSPSLSSCCSSRRLFCTPGTSKSKSTAISSSSSTKSRSRSTALYAAKKQKSSTSPATAQLQQQEQEQQQLELEEYVDPEAPADIVGSQFFGGSREKEEFYDPIAEAQADLEYRQLVTQNKDNKENGSSHVESSEGEEHALYDRFADRAAFKDDTVAEVASSLQRQMNAALYEDADNGVDNKAAKDADTFTYTYASNLEWTTPLQVKARQPLQELESALDFYRRVNLAITSGERVNNNNNNDKDTASTGTTSMRLRWELSLAWPIFWEPSILVTGTSVVTITDNEIVRQVDTLDQKDLLKHTIQQVLPRFWDFYHVGMSPSAEIMPRLQLNLPASPIQRLFAPYKVIQVPGRLVLQPSVLDLGDRDDGNAGMVPNHAFNCVIKTMGPQKQRYVPASPVQVRLVPQTTGPLRLQWSIPVAVECLTSNNSQLTVPPVDEETAAAKRAEFRYQWEEARTVATLPYGGGPQDEAISNMRKRLYEKVVQDGLKPKLDVSGRPLFFFWQNNVKACYTQEGLGMAVYDWRPGFVKCNEVGIELESVEGAMVQSR